MSSLIFHITEVIWQLVHEYLKPMELFLPREEEERRRKNFLLSAFYQIKRRSIQQGTHTHRSLRSNPQKFQSRHQSMGAHASKTCHAEPLQGERSVQGGIPRNLVFGMHPFVGIKHIDDLKS
mmetsp:Transcript_3847/g.8576  ORF Transcript_3847/g.8576 Transcript_3847/m.8576 type:complete len:122 (-) Transcript_3847:1333-1698(-)